MKNALKVVLGAAVGGFLGYHAYWWILSHGFFGLVLPGGLLAFGASLGRNRSVPLAVLCGIAATLLGFYADWKSYVVVYELEEYVRLIPNLSPVTLIMIALGGGLGFYVPFRQAMDWKSLRRPA